MLSLTPFFLVLWTFSRKGNVNDYLKQFLQNNLPATKPGKKAKFQVGVPDSRLASAISETTGIKCTSSDVVHELHRGIRYSDTCFPS